MSELLPALGQIGALVVLLALTVPLLARYLATVYTSERHLGVERAAYRVLRVDPDADQHWRSYAMSVLGFSLVGILLLFGLGRLQQHLPLSLGFPALPTEGAWNTAVSFVTNTNWQWYSGEAADRPPHADVRADRPELRERGGRHVRGRGVRPRPRADRERRPGRQLLRRPGAHRVAGAAAHLAGGGLHAHPVRRDPELRPRPRDAHADRRQPGPDRRAGRQPGGDQGARHQRRRLLQRQLRAPVREPDAVHRPARDLPAPGDPVRDGVGLRPDRQGPPPGHRHRRRDGAAAVDRDRAAHLGRDGRARHRPPAGRRCHGGQGDPLRRGRLRAVRARPPRVRRPARSTPCTTR